ncbi:MAG: hypothetical protein JSS30_01390 [Verrucomicrobia bacterium]|nr:hypothetical protein [Verrucomicrobiota bacterium]
MFKSAYLLLLSGLPSLVYSNCEANQCCDPFTPPEPLESCQLPVGYFYPAQYTFGDCGFDISLSGEFIYWELNRDSTTQVGTKVDLLNDGTRQEQKMLYHQQGYRPGFKVAAGIGLPGCDAWTIDLEYTWFHHHSTNTFRASENGYIQVPLTSLFFDPILFFYNAQSVRSVLKFNLDFLQGTLGRAFYISKRLIIDAGVGAKSWWTSFRSDLLYNLPNGSQLTSLTKSGVWGIGPYVTANIKGLLWCGTYLYGKAGIWITYTRFDKIKAETNVPNLTAPFVVPGFNNNQRLNHFVYTTNLFYEGGIGLGWGTYLCDCNYHIDFLVGYEMMTNYIKAVVTLLSDPQYEFYYQGLSVKAQFDF